MIAGDCAFDSASDELNCIDNFVPLIPIGEQSKIRSRTDPTIKTCQLITLARSDEFSDETTNEIIELI